jgi:replication factor C subunit 2/4
MIAQAEGVTADPGVSFASVQPKTDIEQVLELILKLANGDLRKAITYLQTAQRLHSAGGTPTPITTMSSKFHEIAIGIFAPNIAVHEISGVVPDEVINSLLHAVGVEPGEGVAAMSMTFDDVRSAVRQVGREGWSAGQVLEQLHDALIPLASIGTIAKSTAAIAIAECDKALCEGGDEQLQLLECCLRIKEAMGKV